jgi:hypothetical protein
MIDVDADSDNDVSDVVPFRLHLRKDTCNTCGRSAKIVGPLDIRPQPAACSIASLLPTAATRVKTAASRGFRLAGVGEA